MFHLIDDSLRRIKPHLSLARPRRVAEGTVIPTSPGGEQDGSFLVPQIDQVHEIRRWVCVEMLRTIGPTGFYQLIAPQETQTWHTRNIGPLREGLGKGQHDFFPFPPAKKINFRHLPQALGRHEGDLGPSEDSLNGW